LLVFHFVLKLFPVEAPKPLRYSDFLAELRSGKLSEATGAADDLERASALVRQMVTRFGMSDPLGKMTYGRPTGSPFLKLPFEMEERNYSERTAEMIDSESRRILDDNYGRVMGILLKKREPLARISQELMRKETLERAELDRLMVLEPQTGQKVPVG